MAGSLARLAVGLAAVLQLTQQEADQLLTDLEPLAAQSLGEGALAAADPAQRRFRVAADRILDQALQRGEQPRLTIDGSLATAARTPDGAAQVMASGLQFRNATVDRAPRHPSSRRRG